MARGAKPATTQDRAFQAMGLAWANAVARRDKRPARGLRRRSVATADGASFPAWNPTPTRRVRRSTR